MKRWWKWIVAAVVVLLVAGLAARVLSARKAQQQAQAQAAAAKSVTVVELAATDTTRAQIRELEQGLPVTGALKAVTTAFVKARVPGELQGLTVREGDAVKAGQVVARIEPTEYQARLRQAQDQANAAKVQIDIAQRQFDNNRALMEKGFTTTHYDGQFFFDTDHPVYANEDGTGAVTPESNMQAGVLEPWVLLCTERAPKAIYMQERIKPQFDAVTSANNPNVFDLDVYSFGGRWRGAAAYGFWQLAQASKAALTAANFNDAFKAMEKRKGDGGRLLGVSPDLLVVGPDNRVAAEQLLKARDLPGGGSNTNFEKVFQSAPVIADG